MPGYERNILPVLERILSSFLWTNRKGKKSIPFWIKVNFLSILGVCQGTRKSTVCPSLVQRTEPCTSAAVGNRAHKLDEKELSRASLFTSFSWKTKQKATQITFMHCWPWLPFIIMIFSSFLVMPLRNPCCRALWMLRLHFGSEGDWVDFLERNCLLSMLEATFSFYSHQCP